MQALDILIKPIISEKSLRDAHMGKFTFLVNADANKTEIKKAVQDTFAVKVVGITTVTTKGSTTKVTKLGRKVNIFKHKKARVMLEKGQTIDMFEEHLGGDDKKTKKAKKVEKTEKKVEAKKEKKEEAK